MGDYYLEKINYKLLNILLIIIAIFFITKLDFYKAFLHTILDITFPIFLAFFISYSLYPCVSFLTKKISYLSSCLIVIFLCISLSILLISFSIPIFTKELPLISNDIMYFLSKTPLETKEITSYLNDFLSVESGIHLINEGASFLTSFLIVIVISIYFLFNMQKIKTYLNKYELFTKIDRDLFNYYKGFYLIILIEIVEYLVIYFNRALLFSSFSTSFGSNFGNSFNRRFNNQCTSAYFCLVHKYASFYSNQYCHDSSTNF